METDIGQWKALAERTIREHSGVDPTTPCSSTRDAIGKDYSENADRNFVRVASPKRSTSFTSQAVPTSRIIARAGNFAAEKQRYHDERSRR